MPRNTDPDSRAAVCLLRAAAPEDPYARALEAAGFEVAFRPVLRFEWVGQTRLRERLQQPQAYAGLILTSPRAVDALRAVAEELPQGLVPWTTRPSFAVGPKTAALMQDLGLQVHEAAGASARMLADSVIDEAPDRPLLFLCGNRRRDELPDRLAAEDVPFEEICVYETHLRTDLDFTGEAFDALAFFSPSGVEAVQRARGLDPAGVRCIAIGPTTAAALTRVGWGADAIAEEPTPAALVSATRTAFGRTGR